MMFLDTLEVLRTCRHNINDIKYQAAVLSIQTPTYPSYYYIIASLAQVVSHNSGFAEWLSFVLPIPYARQTHSPVFSKPFRKKIKTFQYSLFAKQREIKRYHGIQSATGVRHIGVQILLANQVKKRLNMRCSHNIPLQYLPLDLGLFFLLDSPHYSKLFFFFKSKYS